MKQKIVTIVGARPQFIKASVISRALRKANFADEIIIHTGQHFDDNMSHVFFKDMGIPEPDYNLGIHNLPHGAMTGRMLEEIEKILISKKPDMLIVYGDTNSTLAGALAAQKLHIPVAHVEAGLRSFNMLMPEETNRILTDRISSILFVPTENGIQNLKKEGFDSFDCKVELIGDVMYDASLYYAQNAKHPDFELPEQFALVTMHRAENTQNKKRLLASVEALQKLSKKIPLIFPMHPGTAQILQNLSINLSQLGAGKIKIVSPVGYFEMLYLLKNCELVVTDSGGLQKEAYFFKKSCITMRTETEWTELVKNKVNTLIDVEKDDIIKAYESLLHLERNFPPGIYGQGDAGEKAVRIIEMALT